MDGIKCIHPTLLFVARTMKMMWVAMAAMDWTPRWEGTLTVGDEEVVAQGLAEIVSLGSVPLFLVGEASLWLIVFYAHCSK